MQLSTFSETQKYFSFFTIDSLGNYNYALLSFFLFYLIYTLFSFNSDEERFSIQPLGIFYGTFYCLIFTLIVSIVNSFFQTNLSPLFYRFCFFYLFCIVTGIFALVIIRETPFSIFHKIRIRFFSEIAFKAYVFFSLLVFHQRLGVSRYPGLRLSVLILFGFCSYFFIKMLNNFINTNIRVFKERSNDEGILRFRANEAMNKEAINII